MRRLIDFVRNRLTGPNTPPQPAPPPAEPEREASEYDELRDFIRREVAGGFYDDDMILRNAADVYEEEFEPEVLRRQAQQFLREALREHRAAQSDWPTTTDCDRLDAAFDALEAQGVVCRQNFTCCGTCGVAEIGDEIDTAEAAGLTVRGFAFYHSQDTEAAIEGRALYLNYGAVEDDAEAAVAVGRTIAAELTAHGLPVDWDGDLSRRIAVPLTWQRRR